MASLTYDEVSALVEYDPETGVIVRKAATRPQSEYYVGKPTGYLTENGYLNVLLLRKQVRAHRIAWLLMTGGWPVADVDHINGVRTDNRWCNLRAATRTQNLQNMGIRTNNTSGIKGVSWDAPRSLWKAQICVNKKRFMLGRFPTKEEAATAYREAAEKEFGAFARAA